MKKALFLLSLALLMGCRKNDEIGFTVSGDPVEVGESIYFTTFSDSRDNNFTFDLGDGTVKKGFVVSHVYENSGVYTVTQYQTINNFLGGSKQKRIGSRDITVTGAQASFQRTFTWHFVGNVLLFNNTTVENTAGYPVTYHWDVIKTGIIDSANTKNLIWTPKEKGEYTIKLTARQGKHRSTATDVLNVE